MTPNELTNSVFTFVPKILEFKQKPPTDNKLKLKGSAAERGIIDWSDKMVHTAIIIRQKFHDFSDEKISVLINKIEYGFADESTYKEYYKFVYAILQYSDFQDKISQEYLKEKVLLWIIDVNINGRVKEDFWVYIYRNIDQDVHHVTYYYPILNIDIEKEFKIGNSRITYFTKENSAHFFEGGSSIDNDDGIQKMLEKFQGKVHVAVTIEAEEKLAGDLALRNANYAIDILKLTGPTVAIPNERCYIELESKMPFSYEYFSCKENNISKFSFHVGVNREHELNYTSQMIDNWSSLFNAIGFLNEKSDQLSILVSNSVRFFSKCMSENDLHLRVTQLVMIIEGIFLKDDEKYQMEKKSKKRLLEFRFRNDNQNKERFGNILDNMYQIRHKMTHKSKRLYIDNSELALFQMEIINIFQILLSHQTNFHKEDFLNGLDEKINYN